MEIKLKQEYPKIIGGLRVSEDVYNEIEKIANENEVSLQTVTRSILEEAYYSGLVVKK